MRGNHGPNEFGLVSPGAIPNDDASPGNVALELKEEFPSEDGIDVGVLVESKDETDPAVLGRHNNGGNGRDFLMRSGTVVDTGSVSTGCPGTTNERCHQEAAFINERQRGF